MFYTGRQGSTVWLLIDYTQYEYIFFLIRCGKVDRNIANDSTVPFPKQLAILQPQKSASDFNLTNLLTRSWSAVNLSACRYIDPWYWNTEAISTSLCVIHSSSINSLFVFYHCIR